MEDQVLRVEDALAIHSIFKENNWFEKQGQNQVHTNLINLIANLTPEQKDLVLELAGRYLWVSFQDYFTFLLNVLEKVEDVKLNKCSRIIIFPIIKPEDEGKIKSSSPFLYMFKGVYFAGDRYSHIKFSVINTFKDLVSEKFKENDLLFLVDDYIGSGETLYSTLEEVSKNNLINNSIINVVSLVAQAETLQELDKRGIAWYVKWERKKGISAYYETPHLEINISLMKEIEKLLTGDKFYSFGYNESEALVTLNRTPDNTFPIFWRSHKKGGKVFKAPFPR